MAGRALRGSLDARAQRGHARNGAEALAGLALQHLLARLVVAVVGEGDGQRGGVVLLRPAAKQMIWLVVFHMNLPHILSLFSVYIWGFHDMHFVNSHNSIFPRHILLSKGTPTVPGSDSNLGPTVRQARALTT